MRHPVPITPVESPDAEKAVLGACMVSGEACALACAALTSADFVSLSRRLTFEGIVQLVRDGVSVEVSALSQQMRDQGTLERAGGHTALSRLMSDGMFSTSANVEHYLGVVQGKTIRRRLADAGNTIYELAKDESTTPTGALANAEDVLKGVLKGSRLGGGVSIADAVARQLEIIHTPEADVAKVATGVMGLDDALIGGLRGGWNVVVLAVPGGGKTAFALGNVVVPACQAGYWAVVGTQEMTDTEVAGRCLAAVSAVPPSSQMRGADRMSRDDLRDITDHSEETVSWSMEVISGCTVQQLRLAAERMKRAHGGLGVVMLDYAQITPVVLGRKSATRTEEIEHVSGAMKAIARDLGCIALTLSQPTAAASRSGAVRRSDGKGAQALEADADAIIIPWRSEDGETAKMTLDKFRSGPFPVFIGPQRVQFSRSRIRFETIWA